MPVIVSLLRGVNVGGHHKIKMDSLRALYASLGLETPQTYVQSGNVVFKTAGRDLAGLRTRIEDALERSFGFRPDVILRTASELRNAIARNPFAPRTDVPPNKLLVTFLAGAPHPEGLKNLLAIEGGPEEIRIAGREVYIYFPNGMGRSKLPWAATAEALKTTGTGRNWNTVLKLLEMAEKMESG